MPTIDRRTSADPGSPTRNNVDPNRPTDCTVTAMFVDRVFAWVFLSVVVDRIEAGPARMQRMTVNKMRAEDLESSASGYVYNQQQGLPVYYLHYTDHGSGSHYRAPDAVVAAVAGAQYVAAPVAPAPILQPYTPLDKGTRQEILTYANHQLPDHVALPVESKPRAPYYFEKTLEEKGNGSEKTRNSEEEREEDSHENKEDSYENEEDNHENEEDYHRGGDGDSDEDIRVDNSSEEFNIGDEKGHGKFYGSRSDENGGSHGSRGDDGSASEDVSGEKYATQEEYSKHGKDGDEVRKSRRRFSKGGQGARDNEDRKEYYSETGEREKGNADQGKAHGSREEAVKTEKGSNYGHSSYREKGDKTKGYRNVYRKDEYKKETDFYDEDREKGYFDKFEKFDKGLKRAEGEFEKGGHRSSGHDQEDSGKKGYYDEGHDRSQDQGHRAEQGEKSYRSNHEDYAVKGGSKSAKEDEFRKDSDYH